MNFASVIPNVDHTITCYSVYTLAYLSFTTVLPRQTAGACAC